MICSGLWDKLYWRPSPSGWVWHCYSKGAEGRYVSLCGAMTRTRSGGQQARRPPVLLRCGRCDVAEIERRGWDESGPESADWRDGTPHEKKNPTA